MKKKSEKKKDIDALHQDLEQSGNLFVTGYEKLRVDQDFELRKAVRGAGGKYRVIKNNLAEIAAQGTPSEGAVIGLAQLRGMYLGITLHDRRTLPAEGIHHGGAI